MLKPTKLLQRRVVILLLVILGRPLDAMAEGAPVASSPLVATPLLHTDLAVATLKYDMTANLT